ncbi:hypothetical protein RGRSB_0513 [cyanobacterium endosymbiont of Rhopalodia gibberula]|uniref:DUF2079 domain-containing protein n=1 Tax=cyanobacterium endosymbiont of Rhopalodia gibberula TaxID=1763363 RepID=UPI000DC720D3|nr:DUF2079 domain-containing protein [cyanobacterium endosymbiont of Rhopalodia gibberula]BBA79088.1 hypothetical protein RGRSB_0513 [cyanobacterium endosymbiont of Rhopalodia gibberula]
MKEKNSNLFWLWIITGTSTIILFLCASLRHFLFQSNALDLGWFDQAIFLISQGNPPIVSFVDNHILGDHAAFILYPLALFYVIYPNVHWLFAIQAVALGFSAVPVYRLAQKSGLQKNLALTMSEVYLLYPLVFNLNIFDFHSEVIALPILFWAILEAKNNNFWRFLLAIIIILSCKAVLSLTVAAMGLWLFFFERKRLCGSVALSLGIFWLLITTQVIIPQFSGNTVAALGRYSFLGDSIGEIIKNIFLNPGIFLSKIFTLANLEYLILLVCPVIWGLSLNHLAPMVAAIPQLGLNLLTDYQPQKDLVHQYSLPILPFLLLSNIYTLAAKKEIIKRHKIIIIWSLITFLVLAKYNYFGSKYLEQLDTLLAMKQGIKLVPPQVKVLTSPQIAPHLTHRPVVKLGIKGAESIDINNFDYILLNVHHPSWPKSKKTVIDLVKKLKENTKFISIYEQDNVFLFKQN